jgi:tartrate dehydratase alpha subunit/fumarate hydratase class I-like protein
MPAAYTVAIGVAATVASLAALARKYPATEVGARDRAPSFNEMAHNIDVGGLDTGADTRYRDNR